MNEDAISRAAAKAKKVYSEERHEYVVPVAELDWLPSVPPQVVHGRWGEYESFPMAPSLNGHPCSECGMHFSASQIIFMNYCPNCGAKMDGGEDGAAN